MVMYGGHIVESGPVESVLREPLHPYTQLLLSAVPDPRAPLNVDVESVKAEPPKVINPAAGLPVPRPLPDGRGGLLHRHAQAGAARPRARGGVPRRAAPGGCVRTR